MKNKVAVYLCVALFGIIGVYFTFVSGNISKYDSQAKAYSIDKGEDTDSDGTVYYPTYYFRVNGKNYSCKAKSGSSTYPKESKNKVYYDSKNPENCMTEYEKSTSKVAGIVCLAVAVIVLVLSLINPSKNNNETNQPEEVNIDNQYLAEEQVQKAMEIVEKVKIIIIRVILAIIILVLLAITLFDTLIIKQTIEGKDYIETTATYVSEKETEEESPFKDYIYSFEDKKGKEHEITITLASDTAPSDTMIIKYDENNPKKFLEEGQTFDKKGIIGYAIKIVIILLLVFLFFNKKLLSKIRLSVSNE